MDNATWALARMNMFLHGHPTAELWRGNTLAAPYFKNPDGSLRNFDFAVANPPFSAKAWSNGLDPANDEFRRFEYGIPPARNGDYAFLLHLITSLRSKGNGAIILPHGVLFRGNREADIRRNLVRRGLLKGIIHDLSEDLLARFADVPLLDPYDVYQRLMDYWDETMQDEVYLVVADGWVEAARPRGVIEDRDRKLKEIPDLTIGRRKYKMDLVPPALMVARYFGRERAVMDELRRRQETAARELDEFVDEHTGEGALLEGILNDRGKVPRGTVQGRLDAIEDEDDPESEEERDALARCLSLLEAASALAKTVRTTQSTLDERVLDRYSALTESEIKTLVVEDKWLASIRIAIEDELQRVTRRLAGRVRVLEERYARPLPKLKDDVEEFGAKVEGHLKRMGLSL